MAVSALPRSLTRAPLEAATLPPVTLALTLVAPALDLLRAVQPSLHMPGLGVLAASAAAAALVVGWARFPRTSWLVAATLAAIASMALRLIGTDVAPGLSLLAIIALGIGGAFASRASNAEAWLG
ncbi:MAG: hypothetical protein ACR2IK_22200 [Chloroflexota bacterium]